MTFVIMGSCEADPTGFRHDPEVHPSLGGPGCDPHPECARPLSDDEKSDVNAAIDRIRGDGCVDMADRLQELLDDGRIFAYDEDDGRWGDIHNWSDGDPSTTVIDLWAGAFVEDHVESTARHEYGHDEMEGGSEDDADLYITS